MIIEPAALVLFLAAVVAICITPGPDMLYILAHGLTRGPGAGLAAACGMAAGMLCHTSAAALGLSAVFAAVPLAFDIVRYAGAAYLLWLAYKSVRTPPLRADSIERRSGSLRRVFWQGMATNLLNPKIALFYLAFLPQFVDPERGLISGQFLLLGTLFAFVGLAIDAAVGVVSGRLGLRLTRNRRILAALQWLPGAVFVGLAARLVLAERR